MIGLWALLQQSPTRTKTNHVSNTECLSVTIMLLLCQALRQGINNVVIHVILLYYHISSDEMEVLKSMFGSLMRSWVSFVSAKAPFLSQRSSIASAMLVITLSSYINFLIQTISFATLLVTLYATFGESTTVSCFELF
ncbi:hypothetical protein V6N12_069119 [Hibiscus sabdariffa]|uniref:Uncharacterized protein n=1 Tax=Hibiscus sabdariffa TaxID=183260 RepID=A0ABR2FD28_9ROSI